MWLPVAAGGCRWLQVAAGENFLYVFQGHAFGAPGRPALAVAGHMRGITEGASDRRRLAP
jgi:hypothetical protein